MKESRFSLLTGRKKGKKVHFHSMGGWRLPEFLDLVTCLPHRRPSVIGQSFLLFLDQLLCKPAKHGGVVAWHKNFSYWTFTRPMHHLTCWIGLDDAKRKWMSLFYFRKSHGAYAVTGFA